MSIEDDELIQIFLEESREHLATIESDLLAVEQQGDEVDPELLNKVFRTAHSIKGSASFFGFRAIPQLGHKVESVLELIRSGKLKPSNQVVTALLQAFDQLKLMLSHCKTSDADDIQGLIDELSALSNEPSSVASAAVESVPVEAVLADSFPMDSVSKKEPENVTTSKKAPTLTDETLRIPVSLLENLMNLAGELVLGRNQLLNAIQEAGPNKKLQTCGQRLSLVTSELQEAIMQTRMQPLSTIMNKFQRMVRDLAKQINKEVNLEISGKEVELDKAIIEGLTDPLSHMIRNAIDHGLEDCETREKLKKPRCGTIAIHALHQAGQVVLEISDDGRGIPVEKVVAAAIRKGQVTQEAVKNMSTSEKLNLIFLPGLSTADKVTDLSGRGVGMDVVKTNLDELGGIVSIDSVPGKGSTFRITLPLTLAIIPCLLIVAQGERFAIPQINVKELLRIKSQEVSHLVELVGDIEVLRLRDSLIPIIRLTAALGIPDKVGDLKSADLEIAVVQGNGFDYALVLDEMHDSMEIVVRPLGSHLKGCRQYAGATILGDGTVALILDTSGLASMAGLASVTETARAQELERQRAMAVREQHPQLLLFHNHPMEPCVVALSQINRLERIQASQIEEIGGLRAMQYRDKQLPLVTLRDFSNVHELEKSDAYIVLVMLINGEEVGLLGTLPVDTIEEVVHADVTHKQRGIAGTCVVRNRTTLIVIPDELALKDGTQTIPQKEKFGQKKPVILLAEDSDFFHGQMKRLFEESGFAVLAAPDGQVALEMLLQNADKVQIVVTDIEMPRMNGLELARQIRSRPELMHLPIIAVTSLADPADFERGKEAGIDHYQIKFDKTLLLDCIQGIIGDCS